MSVHIGSLALSSVYNIKAKIITSLQKEYIPAF
jgi:hypothetical protein